VDWRRNQEGAKDESDCSFLHPATPSSFSSARRTAMTVSLKLRAFMGGTWESLRMKKGVINICGAISGGRQRRFDGA
jgi:hypothetical protein